jgi:hypothetical protein
MTYRDVYKTQGWALAALGEKEGVTLMCQGLAAQRATGAGIGRTMFLALLAEGHKKERQIEEGLAIVTEALVLCQGEVEG